MDSREKGQAVHFEYTGTDPAGAVVNVYRAGSNAAIDLTTLGLSGLAINSIFANTVTGGVLTVFGGNDTNVDVGERVVDGTFNANGGVLREYPRTSRYLIPATALRVTGAGVVKVNGTGFIYKS